MSRFFQLPGGYNDWRLALGAQSHVGRLGVALLVAAAALAIALSALSLIEERRARGGLLLVLRAAGVLACLATALEPTVELRQVTHVPNRVAVLVDGSRSMDERAGMLFQGSSQICTGSRPDRMARSGLRRAHRDGSGG